MAREKKEPQKPSKAWMDTYGDMITLMLCFFVMLYNPSEVDVTQLATITQSLQMTETENTSGGMSLSAGRLSDLGNNINSLPSLEKGKSLGLAKKKAVSLFAPDVKSNRITITSDERGLIITLLSDNFFEQGSAELNINETRETLLRLADFFKSPVVVRIQSSNSCLGSLCHSGSETCVFKQRIGMVKVLSSCQHSNLQEFTYSMNLHSISPCCL